MLHKFKGVYNNESSQWHTADPLPAPYNWMTSVTIADTCYLLGGRCANNVDASTVLYASLTSLIQKGTSSSTHQSVWKTLPDTPLLRSAAASLSGSLLAVGGFKNETYCPSVYVFLPLTNSWVRIKTGDLPEPRDCSTAVQLSSNTMMVIGGEKSWKGRIKTVLMGVITV